MKIVTSYNNLKVGVENGIMVARECNDCHEWLPASEFYNSDSGAYGKYNRCKKCYNRRHKEAAKKRKEQRKAEREARQPRPHTHEALKRKYDQLYEAYESVCKENFRLATTLKDIERLLEQ